MLIYHSVRCSLVFILVLLLVTSACATATYQPHLGTGFGFSETPIASDTYKVTFEGRAPTKRLNAFVLYRCAELAIAKGFSSFNLVYGYNVDTNTLGINGKAIAIVRFDSSPSGDPDMGWYDARRILEELSPLLGIPSHDFVANPRSNVDVDYTAVVLYPFFVTSIDSQTYRVQLSLPEMTSPSGYSTDWFKLLDMMLWHRLAQFAVDSGADYFVLLSGSGRIGSYGTGAGQNTYYHPYNERSVIVRLFKGERPAALPAAFMAQDILDSAGLKFRHPDEKVGKVSSGKLDYPRRDTSRIREIAAIPLDIRYRDPSMISYKRTPADLEERLFVRCAEATLADGYDYFSFVKEEEYLEPWQQDKPGEFIKNSYASGTPVFSGNYDMKYDDIRIRIRKFRKRDGLPPDGFVFDAADIMHNIGQRL